VPHRSQSAAVSEIRLQPGDVTTELRLPGAGVGAGIALAVLSVDDALLDTVEQVVSADHAISICQGEGELADLVLSSSCGVALIDAAAVTSRLDELATRLRQQFPDLVLVVAGDAGHQGMLAAQIAGSEVYRFLHKPVSAQRVRLFVDAALRRHDEEHALLALTPAPGTSSAAPAAATSGARPGGSARWLPFALAGLAALGAVGGWLALRDDPAPAPAGAAAPARPAPAAVAAPARAAPAPSATPAEDSRFAALLAATEAALGAEQLDEAARTLDQARALQPDSVRVAFLQGQLGKERERASLARARAVAASSELERQQAERAQQELRERVLGEARAAIARKDEAAATQLLRAAAEAGVPGAQLDGLREQIAASRDSARTVEVGRLAALVAQRIAENRLLEPAADSARAYYARLREADTVRTTADSLRQPLAAALLAEARKALAASDPEAALRAIAEAESVGAPASDVAALRAEVAQARTRAEQRTTVVGAGSLKRTRFVEPVYPRAARAAAIAGWVDLEFTVTPDGAVADVRVTGSEPADTFDVAAVEALSKWRFEPMRREGSAVEQRARLRMRFNLD
jgi:protein TonB